MLGCRIFRLIHNRKVSVPILRCFHHEFSQSELKKNVSQQEESNEEAKTNAKVEHVTGALSQKYKLFREEESPEILDIYEERQRYQSQDDPDEMVDDSYIGLNLKRGLTGVFDIEDLVDVLRKENAEDIFVCSVPKELKYVDYIVVCSGYSYRHMLAMAEFVRRIYKMKRREEDYLPRIEGPKSREWMAIDLGNIALHIFSPTVRESYDLESLWAIGSEYDREYNKPKDRLVELFEKHSALLADISPRK